MKQTLISLAVILVATAICFGLIYERNKKQSALIAACPVDTMMCPDGTSIPRSGKNCEFGACRQDTSGPTVEGKGVIVGALTPDISIPLSIKTITDTPTTNLFVKIKSSVTQLFEQTVDTLGKSVSVGSKEYSKTNTPPYKSPLPITPAINETRYSVKDNTLVDQNNIIIYNLIPNTPENGKDTHVVNAVPVNNIAPVIGAIPVDGLPGKYYLSENSFGTAGNCEFANKIYILDTTTNIKTLLYEENNLTLSPDDPRSCNSEMYLLATENEKLILKYHTVGTNMICDSTWSEPEKTWYLDVTQVEKNSRRYWISPTLSSQAEVSELACRSALTATTTP